MTIHSIGGIFSNRFECPQILKNFIYSIFSQKDMNQKQSTLKWDNEGFCTVQNSNHSALCLLFQARFLISRSSISLMIYSVVNWIPSLVIDFAKKNPSNHTRPQGAQDSHKIFKQRRKKNVFLKCFAICQEHAQRSKIYLRNKTAKTASMRLMPRGVFVPRMRWSE